MSIHSRLTALEKQHVDEVDDEIDNELTNRRLTDAEYELVATVLGEEGAARLREIEDKVDYSAAPHQQCDALSYEEVKEELELLRRLEEGLPE